MWVNSFFPSHTYTYTQKEVFYVEWEYFFKEYILIIDSNGQKKKLNVRVYVSAIFSLQIQLEKHLHYLLEFWKLAQK